MIRVKIKIKIKKKLTGCSDANEYGGQVKGPGGGDDKHCNVTTRHTINHIFQHQSRKNLTFLHLLAYLYRRPLRNMHTFAPMTFTTVGASRLEKENTP